jgi:hypothetical protein
VIKLKQKTTAESVPASLKRRVCSIYPWEVQHQPNHSEIEAYVEITGEWEIIAEIKGINHVAIAEFIVALANEHNQKPILESINNSSASRR